MVKPRNGLLGSVCLFGASEKVWLSTISPDQGAGGHQQYPQAERAVQCHGGSTYLYQHSTELYQHLTEIGALQQGLISSSARRVRSIDYLVSNTLSCCCQCLQARLFKCSLNRSGIGSRNPERKFEGLWLRCCRRACPPSEAEGFAIVAKALPR